MDVGVIDNFLEFLVESLIKNISEVIEYICHYISDDACDKSGVFIDFSIITCSLRASDRYLRMFCLTWLDRLYSSTW